MDEVITSIKATKRAPGRLSVYVGRKFVGALPDKRIDELGLKVGLAWDEPLQNKVIASVKADKALRHAMRLLNRRAYSSNEIRDRLGRGEHEAQAIEQAMATLDRMNLLDDASYGRAVIERATAGKPAGRRLLKHKLMQKKLAPALIEQLLDEAEQGCDATADIRRLAEQRLATAAMRRCDPVTRKRRLWAYLARRGFEAQAIRSVMDAVMADDQPEYE